ncbi:T9SS type A sorting domain-containing protein, partial [candidate division WOR-3 bacterium]|nr:T9SS type A sorting domain-containing protein [candidate division WOR-3 bacterium]
LGSVEKEFELTRENSLLLQSALSVNESKETSNPQNILILTPTTPTLIRIFDNAIYNAYPSSECTLSFVSTDPDGDSIQYEIQWDTDPLLSSPSSKTTVLYPSGEEVTTTIPLDPVDPETVYYWRARATDPNDTGIWSSWSGIRSFTMDMEVNEVYWYQVAGAQFDQCIKNGLKVQGDSVVLDNTVLDEGFETPFPPYGWQILVKGTPSRQWEHAGDQVYSGDSSARVLFHPSQMIDTWLVTDTLDLSCYEACTLSFFGYNSAAGNYQYHGIWASTSSQTDTTTFVEIQQIPATPETTWENSTIDFSTYAGNSTVYLAFRYKGTNGTSWWIDSVTIFSRRFEGTLTSPAIVYTDLTTEDPDRTSWIGAKWTKSSADDSIGIQIEYLDGGIWNLIPEDSLPGNSEGNFFSTAFCNLEFSSLNTTTYDTLRLKTIFRRASAKASSDPVLKMWALGDTSSNVTFVSPTDKPLMFALYRNQPNPFSSSTEISYQLPIKTTMDLEIFDVIGRSVITLVSKAQPAGFYTIPWRGTDRDNKKLPSGIYFLKMTTGSFKDVRKMVILR